MTSADIIDGKAIALSLRKTIGDQTAKFSADTGIKPGLAVVLVGEDPASRVYVRNKEIATKKAGMESFKHKLSDETQRN